jgi:Fic family protein
MKSFVKWINSKELLQLSPLYRAPIAHFYFELIHPFGDGNGRAGRIIEAMLLQTNYGYAPQAISKFYLKNVDQYFTLFNECRKKAERKEDYPNTAFVAYFLERLLDTFYYFYDKRTEFYNKFAFSGYLVQLSKEGKINKRQAAILAYLRNNKMTDKKSLAAELWYQALYSDYHAKTQERDLKHLQRLNLISIENNQIRLINIFPHAHLLKGEQ